MSWSGGLVGREAELAVVASAVRRLGEGRGSLLTIEGEAGIGKTSLVDRIVDDAVRFDLTIFRSQAHPFERTKPFGVVASALDLTSRSADRRRRAVGAMLTGPGVATSARGHGDVRFRVVEEIVDLVETACADRPVVLVAEDIHWADSSSLLALSSVVRHLPLSALLVVVTARPAPLSAEAAQLLELFAGRSACTLQLAPLAPEDIASLAAQVLEAPPGPALLAQLARAGGNPLWAVAMLESLADEGLLHRTGGVVEATTSELPAPLRALVVRRLQQLPHDTMELLQVTAVLGDSVSLRDVAAVAHRTPTEAVRQLRAAFEAQLLDDGVEQVVFRHQLVHDAVYLSVAAPARRLLHREAASVLSAAGADRLHVADHLMLGAERGDGAAIASLRAAAREASAHAPSIAVELVRRAEALLPRGHPDADAVSLEIVAALLRAGKAEEASARADAVLAREHAPEIDTPMRLALVGALALQNRAADLIAAAEASLAGATPLRPADQVPLLAHQSWALTYAGNHQAGEAAAGRALAIAEEGRDPARSVWALTAMSVAAGRDGRFAEALDHARRAATVAGNSRSRTSLALRPKLFLGLALFDCDLVDDARAAFRDALDDEAGVDWWRSDTLVADARACFVIGDWEDAVPRLIASGEAAREKDHPLLASQSLAYRAVIATGAGDLRTARELVAELAGALEADPPPYNAGLLAFAVAGLRVADGDQPGAYEVLLRCWRHDAATKTRYYHRCVGPGLVRLALALGHRDVAAEVAATVAAGAELAPDVPTLGSAARRCRALVDGDVAAAMEAVALARRVPHLVEHAGACEDAAGLLFAAGPRDEAVGLWAEALDRYERAGAEAWAGRLRAELRNVGVRPGQRGSRKRPAFGWESLTATERSVSLLVAEGLTNGAVARRLYISPHTVNTHLRHIFAKLGVTNRVELTRVVHRSIM